MPRSAVTRPSQIVGTSNINNTESVTLFEDIDEYDLDEYDLDEYDTSDQNYDGDLSLDDISNTHGNLFQGLPELEVELPIDVPASDPTESELYSETETLRLKSPPRKAPEYMLDLYDMLSKEEISNPSANIVRSYMNINDDEIGGLSGNTQLQGERARIHTLAFNITSMGKDEEIKLAELRLYTLVIRDRNIYMGVDRKVLVFEILDRFASEDEKYNLISQKHVYRHDSEWEVFDVTSAVTRWVRNVNSFQVLEVRIESVFSGVIDGDMDIDVNPMDKNDPLLVVFSNNNHPHQQHENEIQELIQHEIDSNRDEIRTGEMESDHKPQIKLSNSSQHLSRVKRSRSKHNRRNSCRRKPMTVDFQKINLHGVIVAPTKYMAFECIGKCYNPIGDHLTPTKHAIIQTMMHGYNPKLYSRACCVPTKLEPISVLYYDDNGVITYKYKYDDMVVGECGCR
ncbi:bone morphogenetic protein 10 [Patella vulgata]|uniref:bone morphogenetic protein 10 n=1 Tax=Patella vulgata TaxID=6465 RepID=UPI00218093DD|nr:bone morphogenetic protein 10 [Patella vulgata]